ncbi:ABC transporter permease [Defluviimonas sp. 20V17]|uniref:ABC transporter permease n=1 Tax=Allgaiera indica TaxID=765699 RepID=A0AAN4ZZ77_9RHOB|nr:ABC transporter permease [Allgaiera indica]KDB02572.1 ABC transporter permease [Defluviimonas sp. 20V17]GHE01625.1 ABC transporter permease [Allgaiera indica]SDW97810.1 ABC-type polysaccharide/polyol phosphate export permease [Allgaiera indica]
MFRQDLPPSTLRLALGQLELIYHVAVRDVRKTHRNAIVGLLLNMFQTILMIVVFYVLIVVLKLRSSAIRGDFILYIMSGVFMYMTHTKTMKAVVGADGPTSQMMKHAPMNTIVAVGAAALSALYIQILSMTFVLTLYYCAMTPFTVYEPVQSMGMLLLAWFSGLSIGMLFRAFKPWQPELIGLLALVYGRANMIASGKMFVANTLTPTLLSYFDWNPLFHIIDQARGFIFINYNPHNSTISYPIYVCIACLMIGLMGEFYTRQRASISWGAKL